MNYPTAINPLKIMAIINDTPLTVAERIKALIFFAYSKDRVVVSNPTRSMNVSVPLLHTCVVLYVGRGLATG
jgi:hypothetical protein